MKAMGVILLPPSDNKKYIWLLLYTANIYSGIWNTVKNCTLGTRLYTLLPLLFKQSSKTKNIAKLHTELMHLEATLNAQK